MSTTIQYSDTDLDQLRKNVGDAIKRMKADGMTGCSLDCLRAYTRCYGLTLPAAVYRQVFESCARCAAKLHHFPLR